MRTLLSYFKPTHTSLKFLFLTFVLLYSCIICSQPVFESVDTDETGGDGAYILSAKPDGIQVGDLLLAVACYESGSSQTVTSPADWNSIAKTDHDSDIGLATFYKIADEADVAATDFDFQLSEYKKWTLAISRLSGVDAENPIDTYSEKSGPNGNAKTKKITTSQNDCLILAIYGNKKEATYLGDFNERYEIENEEGGIASQMLETFVQGTAGQTQNTVAKPSEKDAWLGQQIAINGGAVALLNNFRSIATGDFANNLIWERERADGSWLTPSDISPIDDGIITIRNSHIVTAENGMTCVSAQIFIENGGKLKIMN